MSGRKRPLPFKALLPQDQLSPEHQVETALHRERLLALVLTVQMLMVMPSLMYGKTVRLKAMHILLEKMW